MSTKFQQETLKSRFAQAKVLVVGDVMLDRYSDESIRAGGKS